MAVNLSSLAGAGQQFFDNSGVILSGGKLYNYAAGTTTPQTTYTSVSGATAHTNPIVLDSAGRVATGEIWLTAGSNYKFVLYTSTDVLIATWDNITGINGTGITSNASNVIYDPAGTGAVATTVQTKLREIVSSADRVGTVGIENIGVGSGVLAALTSGSSNTVMGFEAGKGITTSYGNTAIGIGALSSLSQTGDQNTAVGRFALLNGTTGYENVAVGTSALGGNTTGNINVAIGRSAMLRNTTGNENVAIGTDAMGKTVAPGVSTGDGNVAVGRNSLEDNTTGFSNTAIGRSALASNTTGNTNVAVGQSALGFSTTGNDNVAVGWSALIASTTAGANVAVGSFALSVATNERNTAIGNTALLTTTTGTNVIGIGNDALATSATTSNEATIGNGNITKFRVPGVGLSVISGNITFAGVNIFVGPGTPEGSQAAPVGSLWLRTDGGANSTLYVKESGTGNTGWVAK